MLTAVVVEYTVVSCFVAQCACPLAGQVPRASITTMVERVEGSQDTEATSAGNRESDIVNPTGKTAPIWKYFGFDRKDKKGKSSRALCKL